MCQLSFRLSFHVPAAVVLSSQAKRRGFDVLAQVEPRLRELEGAALRLHRRDPEWRVWSELKRALSRLAGWEAEQYSLRTTEAYDVAYSHLLHCWEIGRRPRCGDEG